MSPVNLFGEVTGYLTIEDSGQTVEVVQPTVEIVEVAARGPAGPPGESAVALDPKIAGVTLSGHRVVTTNAAGELIYADNSDLTHARRVKWLTTGAVVMGEPASLMAFGEIVEPSWAWTPTEPIYLGANGLLTQVAPTTPTAAYLVEVGVAITSTSMFFNPQMPIVLT